MTQEQFEALEALMHAHARSTCANMLGHHPNTLAKHYARENEARKRARKLMVEGAGG